VRKHRRDPHHHDRQKKAATATDVLTTTEDLRSKMQADIKHALEQLSDDDLRLCLILDLVDAL